MSLSKFLDLELENVEKAHVIINEIIVKARDGQPQPLNEQLIILSDFVGYNLTQGKLSKANRKKLKKIAMDYYSMLLENVGEIYNHEKDENSPYLIIEKTEENEAVSN